VLARLLERGDGPVYALVRGADEAAAAARLGDVVPALLGTDEPRGRAIAVAGDLTRPDLGMEAGLRDADAA
jgi:thioester reductase-like protein